MSATINTAPVAAQVYAWLSGDSIAASGTTSAAAPFALSNITAPGIVSTSMFRSGRTVDFGDADGFEFSLTAAISVCAIEVCNTNASSGEDVTITCDDATTYVAADTLATVAWPQLPADIYTGYTAGSVPLKRSQPTRPNLLLGYDNFTTGPTPAATPAVDTVTVGSGRVLWSTAAAGRTYWEAAYLALGINGRTLPSLPGEALNIEPLMLRDPAGGMGHKYTLSWRFLTNSDLMYLDGLWHASGHGNFPVFLFPQPGQRASATGIISGTDYGDQGRGGLMRLTGWTRTESAVLGSSREATGGRLTAETWQER